MPAEHPTPLDAILDHLRSEPSRTWSIVITVFGDAVIPRGGSLWLGSLLELFAGMAIGSGVVRTAMSRLATDDWLQRHRAGRNSFYRLTEKGRLSSAVAAARIYGAPPQEWNGQLRLVLPVSPQDRDAARSALEQSGFGSVPPGIWIAPLSAPAPAEAAGMAQITGAMDIATGRTLAAHAWALDWIAAAYDRFTTAFQPLHHWLTAGHTLSGIDALVARTLLIHDYRRVVLRDPMLPAALLPEHWPGAVARVLCVETYRALLPQSESWLDTNGQNEDGKLPPPSIDLARRFG